MDDGVEVAVIDTGVGIAPADLGRLTEPLYSTKARGLGLGLALVRMILEKNGGVLRGRERARPGQYVHHPPDGRPRRRPDLMSDATPSILVVDDDIDTCANMADILADLGYRVDVAHEGMSALELVRRRPYDVVLLDYRMPGMDGVALCGAIQRLQSGVVPMLVTAYAGGDAAREAVVAGIWRTLAKPVDLAELIPLVAEAIGQPLVLIVNDDDDLCTSLRDVLREHRFRVCIAHDEAEAIQRLRETTRIVLLDLRLPGRDGALVFRRVRELNPSARVVLITGHRGELEPRIDQLRAEGLDGICYKPFDIPALLTTLDQLCHE